jgi:hypothetical protein
MLQFLYVRFRSSPVREANKIDILKKILCSSVMFLGSARNIRVMFLRNIRDVCSSGNIRGICSPVP